jgi:hypothetical protein
VKAPTAQQALNVVHERLLLLRPVEAALNTDSEKAGPSFSRWMGGTVAALLEVGLKGEADLLLVAARSEIVLNTQIERVRATLESLVDQIHSDPYAIGLRPDAAPSREPQAAPIPTKRVSWAWTPLAFAVGFLVGLYGRSPVDAAGRWLIAAFELAQLRLQTFLLRIANALTPGSALPMPTWVAPAAFWLLLGLLAVIAAIIANVVSVDVRQDGYSALWRSRRCQAQIAAAVILTAIVTALAR